ncbi:hypothetical protein [Chroococcidiopsis cubana]|nr:hypothetical protein [Chroococcidiopsis cubana]
MVHNGESVISYQLSVISYQETVGAGLVNNSWLRPKILPQNPPVQE